MKKSSKTFATSNTLAAVLGKLEDLPTLRHLGFDVDFDLNRLQTASVDDGFVRADGLLASQAWQLAIAQRHVHVFC